MRVGIDATAGLVIASPAILIVGNIYKMGLNLNNFDIFWVGDGMFAL